MGFKKPASQFPARSVVSMGVLKPPKDPLKLAPENDLRSKDQEPAFVERHLELSGEVHGCLAHPVNG